MFESKGNFAYIWYYNIYVKWGTLHYNNNYGRKEAWAFKILSRTRGVVWLITRRGFGLVTGFIHYGDYSYKWLQLLRPL
jgi:hypothetical protein